MARRIVHRLLISFPALLGVLFLCFCLLYVMPADPAMIIAGPDGDGRDAGREDPPRARTRPADPRCSSGAYLLRALAQGDLGRSIITNTIGRFEETRPSPSPPTAELMVACHDLIAVPLGIAAGHARRRAVAAACSDRVIMAISVAGVSMPVFFVGLLLHPVPRLQVGSCCPSLGRAGPVWALGGLPSTSPCRPPTLGAALRSDRSPA